MPVRVAPRGTCFRLILALSAAAFMLPPVVVAGAVPVPPAVPAASDRLAEAREAVMPHVVSILVVREDFADGEAKLSVSSGSGTVIDAQGHVVTNAHVTDRGRSFRVVFGDGREREARLVGQDTAADIAVLRIEGEPLPMPHARFATGRPLVSGETVLAMGAPWGLSNSLSVGVVNNPRRLLVSLFDDEADYEDQLAEDAPTGRYYAWIQHDAAIAPGNSGGPLVDLEGGIVGVNTRGMLFGGDLAFAIPAADAEAVAAALIAHGRVQRSSLGLRLRSLRGTGEREGVLVNAVQKGAPADRAGLRPGDRLLTLDGVAVDAPSASSSPAIQRRIAGGSGVRGHVGVDGRRGCVAGGGRAVERGGHHLLAVPLLAAPAAAFGVDDAGAAAAAAGVFGHGGLRSGWRMRGILPSVACGIAPRGHDPGARAGKTVPSRQPSPAAASSRGRLAAAAWAWVWARAEPRAAAARRSASSVAWAWATAA